MTRVRVTRRLRRDGAPFKLLSALSESEGSVSLAEFQIMLANLHDSKYGMRDTKAQLIADDFVEVRVALTPTGAAALAERFTPKPPKPRKSRCAKRAPTAEPKGTAPTAVPCDSTPLAMAWMGHR